MKNWLRASGTTETIVDYLNRMRRKAIEKGEHPSCGARSTREVADYFGVSVGRARRHLNKLWEADELVAIDDGRTTLWEVRVPAAG